MGKKEIKKEPEYIKFSERFFIQMPFELGDCFSANSFLGFLNLGIDSINAQKSVWEGKQIDFKNTDLASLFDHSGYPVTMVNTPYGSFPVEVRESAPMTIGKHGPFRNFSRGRYAYMVLSGLYKDCLVIQELGGDEFDFQFTDETLMGFPDANGVYHPPIKLRFDPEYYGNTNNKITFVIIEAFLSEYFATVVLYLSEKKEPPTLQEFDDAFFKLPEILFNKEDAFYDDIHLKRTSFYKLDPTTWENKYTLSKFNIKEYRIKPYINKAKRDFWELVKTKQAKLYSSEHDIVLETTNETENHSDSEGESEGSNQIQKI